MIYATDVKTARMQAVADKIDDGSGSGKLIIGTIDMASILATIPLADPSGLAANGVLTLDLDPDISVTASGGGVAAAAKITNSDGTDRITGLTVTVTGGEGDITLDSINITSGQTVILTAGSITHAA